MMRWAKRALRLVLAATCASQALGQGGARAESKQPFEIVRSIQSIQDQIVLGNASARAKLPKVIEQLAERLQAVDQEVWRDTRNARAAVIYTLSGGPPRVIRKVIEVGLSPAPDLDLMRGTLAYVEGREAEARKILLQIDATALPPLLGGHVAMIQSALVAKADPGEAIRLLDQARVMAAGTLVEEAALRRELVLAQESAGIDKFAALSSEYIWRFPNSVYFESFRQRFASATVHFGLASEPGQFAKLENLAGKLEPASQLKLYLQIAQKGIIGGKADAARLAAGKAVQLSGDGSAERARAALYEAAALILTGQFEAGTSELATVDAARLPGQDAELKEAVAALAMSIREDPGKAHGQPAPEFAEHGVSPEGESGTSASASGLIDLARQKLDQIDEVLERKGF